MPVVKLCYNHGTGMLRLFSTAFLKNCRGESLRLWLRVSKGVLSVKYIHSNKASFCVS